MKIIIRISLVFILLILLITTYQLIINFDITKLPETVSVIGWIFVALVNLSKKISSKLKIMFYGLFADIDASIYSEIKNFNDFDSFADKIKGFSEYKILKFAKNPDNSYNVEVINKIDKYKLSFVLSKFYDHENDTTSVFFKFERIINRHYTILKHANKIHKFMQFVEEKFDILHKNSNFDINIEYINDDNPVLKEMAKSNKNIEMNLYGEGYQMTRRNIKVDCLSGQFKEKLEKVLTGNLYQIVKIYKSRFFKC